MTKQMRYNPETKRFEPVKEVPAPLKPKSERKSGGEEELVYVDGKGNRVEPREMRVGKQYILKREKKAKATRNKGR